MNCSQLILDLDNYKKSEQMVFDFPDMENNIEIEYDITAAEDTLTKVGLECKKLVEFWENTSVYQTDTLDLYSLVEGLDGLVEGLKHNIELIENYFKSANLK